MPWAGIALAGIVEKLLTTEKTYRIGEVAELLNLKTYVLRFWETEFTQIEPLRTESGQRLYTEEHVELLRRIKHLLHEQGMTIDGARKILAGNAADAKTEEQTTAGNSDQEFIAMLRNELESLYKLLNSHCQ